MPGTHYTHHRFSALFGVTLAFFIYGPLCDAQSGKAELFGTVRDPANLAVSDAHVQAVEAGTAASFSGLTDDRGSYHLLGLPAGSYHLNVSKNGFQSYIQAGIQLRIGDRTTQDVQLSVGSPSQAVDVQEEVSPLQTASGSVNFGVDEERVVTLPLDGRNFIPLISLSPGVALPGGGSLLPRINGSRPRTNEYIYDGVSALQPEPGQVVFYPIVDAIEEFRVNINSYSPEYGRSNGGAVLVNMKSGTNSLHGTLFEFFRNEDLNGRNYFAAAGSKPEFRRNQYGLAVGGPIQKNKTFFFVDWQGTRLRTGIPRISTVPTAAQRDGIFSNAIYDPATPGEHNFRVTGSRSAASIQSALKFSHAIRCRICPAQETTTSGQAWNPTRRISSTPAWIVTLAPASESSGASPNSATTTRRCRLYPMEAALSRPESSAKQLPGDIRRSRNINGPSRRTS